MSDGVDEVDVAGMVEAARSVVVVASGVVRIEVAGRTIDVANGADEVTVAGTVVKARSVVVVARGGDNAKRVDVAEGAAPLPCVIGL